MAIPGCGDSDREDNNDGTDGGTDTDTDGDTDTDTDTDTDGDTDTDTNPDGCEGVDFLFMVDNSISMEDEQQNLIDSFPGLISAITETLQLDNFHIMVVDSDSIYTSPSEWETHACTSAGCCITWCNTVPDYYDCTETGVAPYYTCAEWLLGDPTSPDCDSVLGAGHLGSNTGTACTIDGDNRYIIEGQTDLNDAFACIADVGTDGNGNERMMEAMVNAIGVFNATDGCNESFIRDEAVLVVTFITDEDEACTAVGEECSQGNAMTWKQALVDAKGGNEEAVVLLGIFGDIGQPGEICDPLDPYSGAGAEAAPLLNSLVDSFGDRGHFCSVCLTDYTDCFLEAVSIIEMACDDLVIE
jgi:hypothetical protein